MRDIECPICGCEDFKKTDVMVFGFGFFGFLLSSYFL